MCNSVCVSVRVCYLTILSSHIILMTILRLTDTRHSSRSLSLESKSVFFSEKEVTILLSDIASKLTVYSSSGLLHKEDEDENEDERGEGERGGDGDARTSNNTHEVSENDQIHIVNILEDLLCGNRISRVDEHHNGHTVIHNHTAKNDSKNLKNGLEKMKFWSSTITSEQFFTILETLKGHKKVNFICCFLFSIFYFLFFILLLDFVFFYSDTLLFFVSLSSFTLLPLLSISALHMFLLSYTFVIFPFPTPGYSII